MLRQGTRDPYATRDKGAGFGLVWQGNTKFLIGRSNPDDELVQVISDQMLVVIPEYARPFLTNQDSPK